MIKRFRGDQRSRSRGCLSTPVDDIEGGGRRLRGLVTPAEQFSDWYTGVGHGMHLAEEAEVRNDQTTPHLHSRTGLCGENKKVISMNYEGK